MFRRLICRLFGHREDKVFSPDRRTYRLVCRRCGEPFPPPPWAFAAAGDNLIESAAYPDAPES